MYPIVYLSSLGCIGCRQVYSKCKVIYSLYVSELNDQESEQSKPCERNSIKGKLNQGKPGNQI